MGPRLVDEVEYEHYGRARRTAQGDFNHSGSITPQDNYDFLNAYFAAAPAGDVNESGTTTTDDVYAFLGKYLGADTTPADRITGWSVFGIIVNQYGYRGYYSSRTILRIIVGK